MRHNTHYANLWSHNRTRDPGKRTFTTHEMKLVNLLPSDRKFIQKATVNYNLLCENQKTSIQIENGYIGLVFTAIASPRKPLTLVRGYTEAILC